ncbi:MAG TPA: GIY-YIG nuclease family protein [Candidatus Paceibacterota bacterium]
MAFVYILKNEDGKYYVGSTVDIEQRLRHHQGGYTPSTHRMGKLELVFSQKFETLKDARNIESRLKKFKRRDYIERIVNDGFIKILPR